MTQFNFQSPKFDSIASIAGIIALLLLIDLILRIYLNTLQIKDIKNKNGKLERHGL